MVAGRTSRALVTLALAVATATAGCRRRVPPAPPPAQAALPALEVRNDRGDGGRWLFTYVQPDGSFATTDDAAGVPAQVRGLVRVIDPGQSASERRDVANVYVVDLGRVLRDGRAPARIVSREMICEPMAAWTGTSNIWRGMSSLSFSTSAFPDR